ncbi:MAG: T9SS type A sorting domain-containing protein [Bacteroidota bacterium]
MKKLLLTLFCHVFCLTSYAQLFGPEQTISESHNPEDIYSCDLDSDGDMDVLYPYDSQLFWCENENGRGNFGPRQVLATTTDFPISVYAADIDLDGDMDVLSASISPFDNNIAWYENTDGLGNFGPQQIITIEVDGVVFVYAADLDGDNDMDVLSVSGLDHKIAWYENLGGSGNFGPQQIITTNASFPNAIYVADVDADNDMDVISASSGDDKIAWYENIDGLGNFGPQQIISIEADLASSVYASDMDSDGDIDVLSGSDGDQKIAWYENIDGLGNFGPQQIISTSQDAPLSVYAADLDVDGDMDIVSAFQFEGVVWNENTDGQGNFSPPQNITEPNTAVFSDLYPKDLDQDGDTDLLLLSSVIFEGKTGWLENLTLLTIDENNTLDFFLYPNPASDKINIQSATTIAQVDIYNSLGQLILSRSNLTDKDGVGNKIDISNIGQGLYYVNIVDENGNGGTKKVIVN